MINVPFKFLLSLLILILPSHFVTGSPPPSFHNGPKPGPSGKKIPIAQLPASAIISQLNLVPNPEKGYFIETFRDPDVILYPIFSDGDEASGSNRSLSTAIYYLLEGRVGSSYWHRVDQAETWHYYAGAPLTLSLSRDDGSPLRNVTLGIDLFDGQVPQYTIPRWEWQSARSLGAWTLVGTTGLFLSFLCNSFGMYFIRMCVRRYLSTYLPR